MFTTEPRIGNSSKVLTGTSGLPGQILNILCILIRDS